MEQVRLGAVPRACLRAHLRWPLPSEGILCVCAHAGELTTWLSDDHLLLTSTSRVGFYVNTFQSIAGLEENFHKEMSKVGPGTPCGPQGLWTMRPPGLTVVTTAMDGATQAPPCVLCLGTLATHYRLWAVGRNRLVPFARGSLHWRDYHPDPQPGPLPHTQTYCCLDREAGEQGSAALALSMCSQGKCVLGGKNGDIETGRLYLPDVGRGLTR